MIQAARSYCFWDGRLVAIDSFLSAITGSIGIEVLLTGYRIEDPLSSDVP